MRCQQTNENCAWRWKQRKGKGSSKEEEITQKINTHHLGDSVASGSLKRREKVVEGEGFLLSFLAVSKKKKKKAVYCLEVVVCFVVSRKATHG